MLMGRLVLMRVTSHWGGLIQRRVSRQMLMGRLVLMRAANHLEVLILK